MNSQEGYKVKGFMCLTDFTYELEGHGNGTKVYPSLDALKEKCKCVNVCGIIEVEVIGIKILQHANYE